MSKIEIDDIIVTVVGLISELESLMDHYEGSSEEAARAIEDDYYHLEAILQKWGIQIDEEPLDYFLMDSGGDAYMVTLPFESFCDHPFYAELGLARHLEGYDEYLKQSMYQIMRVA